MPFFFNYWKDDIMVRKFILISLPEKLQEKFNNMIKNLNRVNAESEGIAIEAEYGERPEYVAIPDLILCSSRVFRAVLQFL